MYFKTKIKNIYNNIDNYCIFNKWYNLYFTILLCISHYSNNKKQKKNFLIILSHQIFKNYNKFRIMKILIQKVSLYKLATTQFLSSLGRSM